VSFLVVALKSPLPPGSKKAAASERKRKSRAKASPKKKMEEKEKRKESMQKLRSTASPEEKKARLAMERKRLAQARVHYAKSYRPFELFVNENYKL